MKRCVSILMILLVLMSCMLTSVPQIYASEKPSESRTIAIVFDNSESMYISNNQAWCQATYAMEVFASMLNAGDTLFIYPMHPITIEGNTYTMESPYKITDASQATTIRDIYTENAGGTPIESIDCAISGLQAVQAANKYLIILTDGGKFSKNGSNLNPSNTKKELDQRIQAQAGKDMTVMYLGVGSGACMPDTKPSEYFVKKQAVNSSDVLATLTDMCNQIFGRDVLPENRIHGNTIEFDISMSKLIVFVQGENISDLKIVGDSGKPIGQQISSQQTMYSTKGSGSDKYESVPDKSLQGVIVTYTNCDAGRYTVEYTGTATSVEVYYEPNADLDFVFTDAEGNTVDPNSLYEGEYRVSFGMKDANTGKLISSDLLGNPKYQGSYSINGKEYPITHNGYNGEVPISLKVGDSFDANLTVTYLSGYTISKNSSDFGWPSIGIQVVARPAGVLKLDISGGENTYYLQELEGASPYIIKVFYEGKQLTGDALKNVKLSWDEDSSAAKVKTSFSEDHYKLTLHHKDPSAPEQTPCGEFTLPVEATYTPSGTKEATASSEITYNIENARPAGELRLEISGGDDLYFLQKLEDGSPYIAKIYYEGKLLTGEALKSVELEWNRDASNVEIKKEFADDHYKLTLHYKDPSAPQDTVCGECTVNIQARYTPQNYNESQAQSTLSYNVKDDFSPLQIELYAPEDYIVISELESSKEIVVKLALNGAKLSSEDFAAIELDVDCGGIKYTITPCEQDSSCLIKLLPTEGIEENDYQIKVTAQHTDHVGRTTQAEDSAEITLSNTPLWVKWLFWIILLIILLLLIWFIMHIRVLPGHAHIRKKESKLMVDGEDQTQHASFDGKIRKEMNVTVKHGGKKIGFSMRVKPGSESYLCKKQTSRYAEAVDPSTVKKIGNATIDSIIVGSVKYMPDEKGTLVRTPSSKSPLKLKHGMNIIFSGEILSAGVKKPFNVTTKLNFKKK